MGQDDQTDPAATASTRWRTDGNMELLLGLGGLIGAGVITIWTIYDHPTDFPDRVVARCFVVGVGGPEATNRVLVADTVEPLREAFALMGLSCLSRHEIDDPVILESWI